MKTNTFSFLKLPNFSLIVVLSVLITSCGSYQNSSYYGDGIYGDTGNTDTQRQTPNDSNNRYKSYFSSLQEENQSSEIFTDIDNYNDYQDNPNNDGVGNNYGGWGSNYTQTDIAIYPNNFGMGWGLGYNGWGNPYFNNGFGWNSPFYGGGFGWNNAYYGGGFGWVHPFGFGYGGLGFGFGGFGWNNPYYGYNNFYGGQVYNRGYSNNAGRRGSVNYNTTSNRTLNSRTTNSQINRTHTGRGNNTYTRGGSFNSGTRSNTPIFRRGESQNRNTTPTQGRSNNSRQERSYTPSTNSTPTRSYTPSSNTGRSSGGNYGGGRSSGGSSSGRSSGGRGGR